jgi:hypothetical protein
LVQPIFDACRLDAERHTLAQRLGSGEAAPRTATRIQRYRLLEAGPRLYEAYLKAAGV